MYQTEMYEGMLAETITIHGANRAVNNAYFARPLGSGSFPGMVMIQDRSELGRMVPHGHP
jgi:dienelactone hydrolase